MGLTYSAPVSGTSIAHFDGVSIGQFEIAGPVPVAEERSKRRRCICNVMLKLMKRQRNNMIAYYYQAQNLLPEYIDIAVQASGLACSEND